MFSNRVFFLLLIIVGFSLLIFIALQFSNPTNFPVTQVTNHNDKINNMSSITNTTFSQVIIKKFEPTATPETNIEAVATSNESFVLEVCGKNSSSHYDSLSILRGTKLLSQFDLINDTDYRCVTNLGDPHDKISITTTNVSGVTKLIITLSTAANATASIIYPG